MVELIYNESLMGMNQESIKKIICDPALHLILNHHFDTPKSLDFASAEFIRATLKSDDVFSISQFLLGKELLNRKIKMIFKDVNKDVLVDFGCGMGNWVLAASSEFKKCYGFDISEERINCALKIKSKQLVSNVSFQLLRVISLPLADNSVDAFLLFNVLPYVQSDLHPVLFSEIQRVLKANGKIYISAVSFGIFPYLIYQALSKGKLKRFFYIIILTIKAILYKCKLILRPEAWIDKNYLFGLAKEFNFHVDRFGSEGDITLPFTKRMFKRKFLGFFYMKEYLLSKKND